MRGLRIADVSIALETEGLGLDASFPATHAAFVANAAWPDIRVHASWADLLPAKGDARVFDATGAWTLTRSRGEYVLDFFTPLRGETPYKRLIANDDWSRGQLALHRAFYPADGAAKALDYPLDELLLVHYLAQRSGVIVHACGVVDDDGKGYLFVGHSGAGKTTTALLWNDLPGVTILSDDRIVIRRGEEGTLMHGTPWHGESRLSAPGFARLTAIFLLEHGDANGLAPVKRVEAVAGLVARSFLPFHDRGGVANVMSLLEDLLDEVPCQRFSFVPGPAAVDAVRGWARHRDA
jgi:hypothetical protein